MPDPQMFHLPPTDTREPLLPRPFRVTSTFEETPDVTTLSFEPTDGIECIRFEPAQIGMVGIPGLGEVPVSFSSDSDDHDHVGMTIRSAGAITRALVAARPRDVVSMRGPYGVPWPLHSAHKRHLVIVAGGLGLAPLRSAVVAATRTPDRYAAIDLIYGARSPADQLFRSDLSTWTGQLGVHLTVDHPDSSWPGAVGVVSTQFDRVVTDVDRVTVMMCGPDVMLGIVGAELVERGVAAGDVWVTLERNMKCSVGLCGHCQLGPFLLCRDGPVIRYDEVAEWLGKEEM